MTTLFGVDAMQQHVTPTQAATWLESVNEKRYRPVNPCRVAQFVHLYQKGLWIDGEDYTHPITFDTMGRLRGGRMRLTAVVESGITVLMHVLVPAPPQPHEIIPSIWADLESGTRLEATRFDGHNFERIWAWLGSNPRGLMFIEIDDDHAITLRDRLTHGLTWFGGVKPGDWVVRQDTVFEMSHATFTANHAYQGAIE